jgi:hypothetical protein
LPVSHPGLQVPIARRYWPGRWPLWTADGWFAIANLWLSVPYMATESQQFGAEIPLVRARMA